MGNKLRIAVVWITLSQVVLVGAVGTGLHGLFGCEHGLFGCEHGHAGCCTAACCSLASNSECADCVFCRRARELKAAEASAGATLRDATKPSNPSGCDGCAVCHLLDKYQSGASFAADPLGPGLPPAFAVFARQDNAATDSILRAFSRGPPAV